MGTIAVAPSKGECRDANEVSPVKHLESACKHVVGHKVVVSAVYLFCIVLDT